MRRGLALALVVSLVLAATAWADETITARTPNQFSPAVTTIDQGEKVTLQNVDIVGHDVTAADTGPDGKPLFASGFVAAGSSRPVNGTEYLTTGTYPFVCTIHPGMEATLEVTSAGTPVPRPEPATLTVKILSKNLKRVLRKRKLKVRVESSKGSVKLRARARARKAKAGFRRKTLTFDEAGTRKTNLRLSKAARRELRGRKKAKVALKATVTDDSGQRAKATATRKLR